MLKESYIQKKLELIDSKINVVVRLRYIIIYYIIFCNVITQACII